MPNDVTYSTYIRVTMFAGRYEVFEELGRGGYGTVFRSHDHNLGREVALKLFHGGAKEVLAVKEARILTHLEGDHILRVFNAGTHQDIPFLATAVAAEGSADDRLGGMPGLRPDLVIRWIRHLLVGLRVTHNAELLHRDVTPSNLFLDSPDHARLGDFGVAVIMEGNGSAEPAGNPYVRSPEAIQTGRVTTASDIWATGITAWRLLTGSWPFEGTEDEIFAEVGAGRTPRLRDQAPQIPRSLALAVEKALEPDPGDRYESAAAMDDAFSRLPALTRIWTEVPTTGPNRRWLGESPRGGAAIEVSVELNARRWNITTRFAETGRRLLEHCDEVPNSRLPQRLRVIFSSI